MVDDQETLPTSIPRSQGVATVRIMVAIGINPNTDRLLLRAAKLAEGLGGELYAIHVRRPGEGTTVVNANVEWYLEQARQLGAHTSIVRSSDIAATLVEQARNHGITHLVIGQSDITRWQEIRHGSIINRILRFRSGIDLYIVTDPGR